MPRVQKMPQLMRHGEAPTLSAGVPIDQDRANAAFRRRDQGTFDIVEWFGADFLNAQGHGD